ncbi:MAG TPA: hypothetical protein VN758_11695, partial [Solirubrobacterales bacterium]|nr:hypothetical protein [Solirubrobacterales bacterium]
MTLTVPATIARADPEAKPAWLLANTSLPTNFPAGAQGEVFGGPDYLLVATNVGAAPAAGPITLTATLSGGLSFASVPGGCAAPVGQTVTCTFAGPIAPGRDVKIAIPVDVSPLAVGSVENKASVQSLGATTATATTTTQISSLPAPFAFLPGFRVPLSEADGSPATLAGSHPYQLSAAMGFPTEKSSLNENLGGAGHLHDVSLDLPPGETVNPAATPVLCTEMQLTSEGFPGCPDASQVGTVDIVTITGGPFTKPAPLYNMVSPPGTAASLGFDALGVGIFVHLGGEVRSDSDYGISGGTTDALALTNNPVFGAQVQLWGDPSAKSHDEARGECLQTPEADKCQVAGQETALLTTPVRCTKQPDPYTARADSWEQPGLFKEAAYESADLSGAPTILGGCNQLDFKAAIKAQPTTNLTDSPSGLDFRLSQPQNTKLKASSPTVLKDATVTLPEGLVVNPAAAGGQAACDPAQIGLTTAIGAPSVHFSKTPPACPDASKLGTAQVITPLLAQIDSETNKVLRDPEGNAIPRPLPGSIYLAKPFANPFGSLLALYLSVEDPASGTYAKLAVRVHADPISGRLTTELAESPQLPIQEAHLHVSEGARASLRTPPACGQYTTAADLVPWAAPEVPAVTSSDSFQTTAAPGGAPCPTTASAAPNKPSFLAGTLA